MQDKSDFQQGCDSEGQVDREIKSFPLAKDEECCHCQQREQNRELQESQFQAVMFVECFKFFPGGFALRLELVGDLFYLPLQVLFLLDSFRDCQAVLLVFFLVFEEDIQGVAEVGGVNCLLGLVFLEFDAFDFKELVDGLLKIL